MTSYEIARALHIIAVISWMAGMLYLPRLFVYHATATTEQSEMLKIMERKLLRYIMNPAMIATWVFGIWLMVIIEAWSFPWFHAKATLVIVMTVLHHMFAYHRKKFAADANTKTAKYFRWLNEAPTIVMIGIIILVVGKPF